jgi:hypothetical protein
MAKKKQVVVQESKPPESPRFSVSFHADGSSMEELHQKMGKAFTGARPKDDSADAKKRGGRRGRMGLAKRMSKKRPGKRG